MNKPITVADTSEVLCKRLHTCIMEEMKQGTTSTAVLGALRMVTLMMELSIGTELVRAQRRVEKEEAQ